MNWKTISENEVLEYNETYKFNFELKKDFNSLSSDKQNSLISNIRNQMERKNLLPLEIKTGRWYISCIGRYTKSSIIALVILSAISSAIFFFGLSYSVRSVQKLATTPTGFVLSGTFLIISIIGLLYFMRKKGG